MNDPNKPPNRRIGERITIDPIPMTWIIESVTRSRFGRERIEHHQAHGRILDVSVSGAHVEGPDVPLIPKGAVTSIVVNDTTSVVRVIRSNATGIPWVRRYGVVFVRLHPQFQEELYALLGQGRPSERAWFRAW